MRSEAEHAEPGPTPPLGKERVLVLGANGPSGRRTVEQALKRGLHVKALDRRTQDFPISHERLQLITGDAADPELVDEAVASTDMVISVVGVAFTRQPVSVYSSSARAVVAAMQRHGRRRLVVISSAGSGSKDERHPASRAERLWFLLFRKTFGRTVYDDMEEMEAIVAGSDLDWTIVRPPALTDEPGTGYTATKLWTKDPYCSRDDLAAMLLDQISDDQFVKQIAAVSSPGIQVSILQTIRREILKR